jgi:hypothetical protein
MVMFDKLGYSTEIVDVTVYIFLILFLHFFNNNQHQNILIFSLFISH